MSGINKSEIVSYLDNKITSMTDEEFNLVMKCILLGLQKLVIKQQFQGSKCQFEETINLIVEFSDNKDFRCLPNDVLLHIYDGIWNYDYGVDDHNCIRDFHDDM